MNPAFRHYMKGPSTLMEKEALIVQARYNLTDMQMAGLLIIHDFFKRVSIFDSPSFLLQIEEKDRNGNVIKDEPIPEKTRAFFSVYGTCSDAQKHFNNVTGHKFFSRFADKILSEDFAIGDYVTTGAIYSRKNNSVVISYA